MKKTLLTLLLVGLSFASLAQVRIATDESGNKITISGSKVVIIEPDIELSVITAGGMNEPRKEWSDIARQLYPIAVRDFLGKRQIQLTAVHDLPDDLPPASRLGQVVRLHEAVAMSIAQYSQPGNVLETKKDRKTGRPLMDWSLGNGVTELREATGADYAIFTYIRDSYSSTGRAVLRFVGFLLLGGDVGGGAQIGLTTLVDLKTGRVVWFNLMAKQTGDLRNKSGTKQAVKHLLKGFPK